MKVVILYDGVAGPRWAVEGTVHGVAAYLILSGIVMAAPLVPPLWFAAPLGLAILLHIKDAVAPAALPWIRYEWKIVLALVYVFAIMK